METRMMLLLLQMMMMTICIELGEYHGQHGWDDSI